MTTATNTRKALVSTTLDGVSACGLTAGRNKVPKLAKATRAISRRPPSPSSSYAANHPATAAISPANAAFATAPGAGPAAARESTEAARAGGAGPDDLG